MKNHNAYNPYDISKAWLKEEPPALSPHILNGLPRLLRVVLSIKWVTLSKFNSIVFKLSSVRFCFLRQKRKSHKEAKIQLLLILS